MGRYRTDRHLPSRPRPQPEFHQLSIFLRVAETRSFTTTARLTGRTQPAISQAIARLEDIYGGDLFERRRGAPLALTPVGEAILPSSRALIDALDEQMTRAARTARGQAGTITLGVDPGLTAAPHRDGIADFISANPEVELRVREAASADLLLQVRERALDLAITVMADFVDPALEHKQLWQERLFVALPAGHAFASRHDLDWTAIARLPLIAGAAGGAEQLAPTIRTDVNVERHAVPSDVLLDMVGLGVGASVMLGSAAVPHRDVIYRPIAGTGTTFAIGAHWRKQDGNPLRHRLLGQIRDRLRGERAASLSGA